MREGFAVDHSQHMCPYLEREDDRCAGVLTLTNLHDALRCCASEHQYCSIYHRIRLGDRTRPYAELAMAQSA